MSETTNTPTPVVPTQLKLNAGEITEQLKGYLAQAEKSLNQLASNIEAGERQITEWRKIQLMIVGQKQVVVDLLSKIVEAPAAPTTTETASS